MTETVISPLAQCRRPARAPEGPAFPGAAGVAEPDLTQRDQTSKRPERPSYLHQELTEKFQRHFRAFSQDLRYRIKVPSIAFGTTRERKSDMERAIVARTVNRRQSESRPELSLCAGMKSRLPF